MDNSRFNIFEATKNAYLFAGRECLYLIKTGIIPVTAQIVTAIFIQFEIENISVTENYLLGLPATVLFSWYVFMEMRLLLLGEYVDKLPRDHEYLAERQRSMKISVITAVLLNMGMSAAIALLFTAAGSGQLGINWPVTIVVLLIIGAMFWGVRLSMLPILSAVGYPFRPALRQTWGMMFSLRLIGMGLLCLFPVAFIFQIFIAMIADVGGDTVAELKLTSAQQMAIIFISAPASLIITTLLNASTAYALKQILGGRSDSVTA